MRTFALIFLILITVTGCRQEVSFDSIESTPLVLQPPENQESSPIEVRPVKPPTVKITQAPMDHQVGESTSVMFQVTAGDHLVEKVECLVDEMMLSCDENSQLLELKDLESGTHQFSVIVEDSEGLKDKAQVSWSVYSRFLEKKNSIRVEKDNKLADILFVIDNSASMHEEQQGIANRINRFFQKIKKLDWRVGIISTDPYEFDPKTNKYNPLADGALLKFPNDQYFIDSSLGISKAKSLFSETIFRPEEGNGHERGIHNTYRSIERSLNPVNIVNRRLQDFYRASAALSVVLVSDEDETLVNGLGNPLRDVYKSRGSELVSLVKNTWGMDKLFQFNSIIVKPNDVLCIGEFESFGYDYYDLSQLTKGVTESICADDYSGALKNIGSGVVKLQKVYNLDCQPLDIDGDGEIDVRVESLNGKKIPGYTIKGDQIEFSQFLKPGDYEILYYCPGPVS